MPRVVLERNVERTFTTACKSAGFVAMKLKRAGKRGFPDRTVFFPGGAVRFVELKRPGEKPTKLQSDCHEWLRGLGFEVFVIDNQESAKELVAQWSIEA